MSRELRHLEPPKRHASDHAFSGCMMFIAISGQVLLLLIRATGHLEDWTVAQLFAPSLATGVAIMILTVIMVIGTLAEAIEKTERN